MESEIFYNAIIKFVCKHTHTHTHTLIHSHTTQLRDHLHALPLSIMYACMHIHSFTLSLMSACMDTQTNTYSLIHLLNHSFLFTVTNLRPIFPDFTTSRYYCFSKASLHTTAYMV